MGYAVATMRTPFLVSYHPFASRVDGDVKGLYEFHRLFDILFRPGHVQDEIPFLLRRNFRTIYIDHEIVVFHQVVDDRFFALASERTALVFLSPFHS